MVTDIPSASASRAVSSPIPELPPPTDDDQPFAVELHNETIRRLLENHDLGEKCDRMKATSS
jgi:hypothetical protein